MRSLRDLKEAVIHWRQPGAMKRDSELCAGDEVLATMRWTNSYGTLAVATSADGSWTFKRSGFLHPRVTVRQEGGEAEVATLQFNWRGGGTLELADGRSWPWASTHFWRSRWAFTDPAGVPQVELTPRTTFVHPEADVTIAAPAWKLEEMPLLVLLGWYLMQMMSQDGAVALG